MTSIEIKQKLKNKRDAYIGQLKHETDLMKLQYGQGRIQGYNEAITFFGKLDTWETELQPKEPGDYLLALYLENDPENIYYGWAEWDGKGFDENYDFDEPYLVLGWQKIIPFKKGDIK